MNNWKSLFGIASVVFSIGFLAQSILPSYAQIGPNISYGSNPYKAFYGTATQGSTSILTTTTDTFVITGVNSNDGEELSVLIDGTTAIPATVLDEKKTYHSAQSATYDSYNWAYARGNLFLSGKATLPVEAGSTLSVNCTNSNGCFYYIQGYFAH